MGNSTSEIVARVSGMSFNEIEKHLKKDLELLQDPTIAFSTAKLAARSDLNSYKVPCGESSSKKSDPISTNDEQSLVCSQDWPLSAKDRHDQVVSNLMSNISNATEIDIATSEIIKRLQAFCRIFEAVLRADEAKRKKPKSQLIKLNQGSLPSSAKAAIKFGLSTLLNLIEAVAEFHPELFQLVLNDANSVLSDLQPMSMQSVDPTLTEAFNSIAGFFDSVICGKIKGLSEDTALHSLVPFFKLSLATASVPGFLLFCQRLLALKSVPNDLLNLLFPCIKALTTLQPVLNVFSWDTTNINPNISIQGNNLTPTIDNDNGNGYLTPAISSCKFYFEFTVRTINENVYLGVCDEKFTSNSSWNDSSYLTISYCSGSAVFVKANESFKFEAWAVNDKIAVFVDMDKKIARFYRNGVKQAAEDIKISCEKVRIVITLSKDASVSYNPSFNYPEDLKEVFAVAEKSTTEFEKLLLEENPSEGYLRTSPGEVAGFILKKLADSARITEYLFTNKSFKFTAPNPAFGVELNGSSLILLTSLQKQLNFLLISKDFSVLSEPSLLTSISSVQSLLMYHLLLTEHLELHSLDQKSINGLLEETFTLIKSVPETKLSEEAIYLVSSCFEVFYKNPVDKLKYILASLEKSVVRNEEELQEFKQLDAKIFHEMARADKVFPAFNDLTEDFVEVIEKYYKLVIDGSASITVQIIEGGKPNVSLVNLLGTTQAAIFSQAGKAEFKGSWSKIVSDFCFYFLSTCVSLLKSQKALYSSTFSEDFLLLIHSSLLGNPLEELLNSLVLIPMEIPLISLLMPLVSEISNFFSEISTMPSTLSIGIGIINECYESPHNYLDNSQLKYVLATPSAIKYVLEFDPQCKTENGCDYLELWLDEANSNKFARWEGENFPKEPVEVINPILSFTFRSDGSVNYWGWKINIRAFVECSYYRKQWPETCKANLELFFGQCATKLVSGQFGAAEPADDLKKVLQNPLFKHGINDKTLMAIRPLTKLAPDLLSIVQHTLAPPEYSFPLVLLPLAFVEDYETGLSKYLQRYEEIEHSSAYSDSEFFNLLVEGSEEVVSGWTALKKKAGVVGNAVNIGGHELDQAERAIFATYTNFFGVVDTMKQILHQTIEAGPTVKLLVKESCQIRTWAQKQKQRLVDGGNAEASYKQINEDIVKKCALLLGAEYKIALQELGISTVMKNLVGNIAKVQAKKGGLKAGSKWKAVQGALKSVSKLKALSLIKNKSTKPQNEDVKEFMRVVELVKEFLESTVAIEKVAEILETRRVKAIARATGLISISKLLSYSTTKHETFIVKAFIDSLKLAGKKVYYNEGLTGVDPELMRSVQKAFFLVIRSLQQDIISAANAEFSFEEYSHFTSLIEGLSWDFKGLDTHMLVDQALSATLKTLLEWAKGNLRQKPLQGEFTKSKCITRFGILPENELPEGKAKFILDKREDQPSIYLVPDFGGNEIPITSFELVEEEKEGAEDAVGEFTQNGCKKWIYITRSEPDALLRYLTGINEDLSPVFSEYEELLGPANAEETKRLEKQRKNLSRNAWSLYKQLLFSLSGAWNTQNDLLQTNVQEMFLKVIFEELRTELSSTRDSLNLETLSTADPWLGLKIVRQEKPFTQMQLWLQEFAKESHDDLAQLVLSYVESVDHLSHGVVTPGSNLEVHEKLKNHVNAEGNYDFFKYLEAIKATPDLSEGITNYLNKSKLWGDWHGEQPKESELLTVASILKDLETNYAPSAENLFTPYLTLFIGTNGLVAGSKLPESTPAEFKVDADMELFKTLLEIKNNAKFANFKAELTTFFDLYPNLPSTPQEFQATHEASEAYSSSLLWTLYGCFTSPTLPHVLSQSKYLLPLLSYTFLSPSLSLSTLSARLLSRIIPNEHSPQSFAHIWKDLPISSKYDDIINLLFIRIGRNVLYNEDKRRGHECKNLLMALLDSNRWRDHIVVRIKEALQQSVEIYRKGEVLEAVNVGAVLFLAGGYGNNVSPFELAIVSVKNCAFSKGVVKKVVDEKSYLVYSVVDDTVATVGIENVVSIEAPGAVDLFKVLAEDLKDIGMLVVENWRALVQSSNSPISTAVEGHAVLSAVYVSLESNLISIISKVSSVLDTDVLSEICAAVLKYTSTATPLSALVLSKVHKQLQAKLKELTAEVEQITQDPTELLKALNEESKSLASSFIEQGISAAWAVKCLEAGLKDVNGCKEHVNQVKTSLLYKLSAIDDSGLTIQDDSNTAEIYQNHSYQLVIFENSNAHKHAAFTIPNSIFRVNRYFSSEITIRAAINGEAFEDQLKYSLQIGNLIIGIENSRFLVQGQEKSSINHDEIVNVRLNIQSSGKIEVSLENTSETFEVFDRSVFNGLIIGKVQLNLDSGASAQLLMLEIHDQKVSSVNTNKLEKAKRADTVEKFAKIKQKCPNANISRLQLLGISEEQACLAISNTKTLSEAVGYAFSNFSPVFPAEELKEEGDCITEVKIFDTADQVPNDFTKVKIFENFKECDFVVNNYKILAFKRGNGNTGLISISIGDSVGDSVGELTIGNEPRTFAVFAKFGTFSNKDRPIKDIIYIKASSIYNVAVPFNYSALTDKESKAINISTKSDKPYYLFLAFNKASTLINVSTMRLETVANKSTTFGLVDSAKTGSSAPKDSTNYQEMSITELYAMLYTSEVNTRAEASNSLITSILTGSTNSLKYLSKHIPLSKLLNYLNPESIKQLGSIVSDAEFSNQLLIECFTMLISSLMGVSSGKVLKTITIESAHNYDNNMDVDDVITIPGASALRIEFDPQCYTENGCDPLRFYESSGRQGEIRCLSGQGEASWPAFEVPGNTVYTYFHSDGSVNYWGYKFDVIPIGGGGSGEFINTSNALQILKELIKFKELKDFIESDRFALPIYVFLQCFSSTEDKIMLLNILKATFTGKLCGIHDNILKCLLNSADLLYKSTKDTQSSHNILQGIIQLLCEVKKHNDIKVNHNWFLDLSDLISDMTGLAYKETPLEIYLFENYKGTAASKLELTFESEHPYTINTSYRHLHIPGAYKLNIEFTEESKAETQHTAFFSKDPEGLVDASGSDEKCLVTSKWEKCGPDIVIDQDGKRVTRTNSNGWGSVLMDAKLFNVSASISYLIENDGGSNYLYLGFIEADDSNTYDLANCVNSDYSKRVWTWKKAGEQHIKGSSTGVEAYSTGDVVGFVIDASSKKISCLKNNREVFVFTDVAEKLVPIACFGGSGQFVVIKNYESLNSTSLQSRSLSLLGDSAYLWFPVNSGLLSDFAWDIEPTEHIKLAQDKLTIAKTSEEPLLVPSSHEILVGRHYLQLRLTKSGKFAVGLFPTVNVTEKKYDNEDNVKISSDEYGLADGDLIGIYADFSSQNVEFYKNNELIHRAEARLKAGTGYKYAAYLCEASHELVIVKERPRHVDLMNVHSDQASTEWGYKLKVTPEFKGRSLGAVNVFLSSSSAEFKEGWETYKSTFISAFKSSAAEELVVFLDQFCAAKGKDALTLTKEDFTPSKAELIYYPELEKLEEHILYKLYLILKDFNKRIDTSIFLFDLNMSGSITELQKVLLNSRNYIFFATKNNLLKKVLEKSKNDQRTEITVDRPKAARHRNKNEVDTEGLFSIFGQIFRALSAVPNAGFRNSERIYKVNYRGEGSIDAGGPYNESMSDMCNELQSSFIRLFVKSANNTHNMGEYRDAWVINPLATSETDLDMYRFIGKLMGAAIRTQNNLSLSLPPLFWKSLLRESLTIKDLRTMDVCIVQIVEILKNPEAHELTADNFSMAYDEYFTTKDSSGRDIEVIENGKSKPVEFSNCQEYADLIVKARLNENLLAYSRIREGLSATVPVDYLSLMSYKQLETLVCGAPDVNVDILKENTDYEGCAACDNHIVMFWEVLKEFTAKERTLFLKFVWGRTKLPSGKDWRHMKITRLNPAGPVNNYMPISHTCFFTLDLPAYSSKDSMKQKLLYAITHCTAIDLDGAAGAGWEDHD